MPDNRYFCDTPLSKGAQIELNEEEFHHLRVLRKQKDDQVEIINGKGILAQGVVTHVTKNSALVDIQSIEKEAPPSHQIILAQAIPRFNRLEYIVEKTTELGVHAFWFFPADKSEKKELSNQQQIRIKQLLISAIKQSGCLTLPQVFFKPPLKQWQKTERFIYGDTRTKAPYLWSWLEKQPLPSSLVMIIGPESGFSENELHILETQLEAKGVHLNSNILRVDTAAICSLSLLAHLVHSKSIL